jgi:flagellar basal-body rod protein FlgB
MKLFGTVTQGLSAVLDLYQARHEVLAENIANSETPGYRARDLKFDEALVAAMAPPDPKTAGDPKAAGDPAAGAPATPRVEPTIDRDAAVKPDGNSVAIDVQVGRLSENAFRIQALTQILSSQYENLKRVIDGGKP